MDLGTLSLKELKDLQTQVSKAIISYEDRKKKEAIAALEDRAREMGFNLNELVSVQATRRRSPAVAKYANPANPSETWSGRGRKPRWFEAALQAGKSADDMAI